jgi:outer membrane immunogenic protein
LRIWSQRLWQEGVVLFCAIELEPPMKKLSLFVALLLVMPPASALAADLQLPFKSPAGAFNWTGFYIGGNAGGAWGNERVSQTFSAPPPFLAVDTAAVSSAASPSFQPGSATAGLQAGYNYQYGNWVFGGELDIEYLGVRGFNSGNFPFPSTLPGGAVGPPTAFFNAATSVSADWLFTARPRVGWAMQEWLLYVTGGLAVGRENFSQTIAILAPFTENSSFATTRAGWTVGGGVEYAIARNWSLRGEYLHVDLGTVNTAGTLTPPFPGLTLTGSVRLTTEIARGGLNYRF